MALKNMRKPFIHIILQIGNQRLTHCFSNFQSCKMLKATVFTPQNDNAMEKRASKVKKRLTHVYNVHTFYPRIRFSAASKASSSSSVVAQQVTNRHSVCVDPTGDQRMNPTSRSSLLTVSLSTTTNCWLVGESR